MHAYTAHIFKYVPESNLEAVIASPSPSTTMHFLSLLTALILALFSPLASAANYTNPLKTTDGSDPHIAWSGGYYYLMTTTWSNLQITRATTLNGLKSGEKRTVWTDATASRCCNVWAVSEKLSSMRGLGVGLCGCVVV